MRRRWLLLFLAAGLRLLSGCGQDNSSPDEAAAGAGGSCPSDLPSSTDCSSAAPSYSQSVAALIETKCLACHSQGNTISSIELFDHASVYKNRRLALTQVYQCKMPQVGTLSAEQRATLLKYFVCDAPEN